MTRPIYDPATHTSMLPDGTNVPHVTTVLGAVGVAEDFELLMGQSRRLAAVIMDGRDRGQAVHADCHAYDDNDLDWDAVDYRIKPYVAAWAEFRRVHHMEPLTRERQIYHAAFNYTGILDGIFSQRDFARHESKRILIDIKTGDPNDAAAHLQTAAYELAYCSEHPDEPIDERWAVWLRPDRRIPWSIVNYTARPHGYLDALKWQACLTVYNEQPARRKAIAA